jgi:hypothetical protein
MVALIEGGQVAVELARELVEAAPEQAMLDLSAVTLLAPIPVPPQIRDFLAFERHLKRRSPWLRAGADHRALRCHHRPAGGRTPPRHPLIASSLCRGTVGS